jgi:hypothetical protein
VSPLFDPLGLVSGPHHEVRCARANLSLAKGTDVILECRLAWDRSDSPASVGSRLVGDRASHAPDWAVRASFTPAVPSLRH